MAWAALPLSSVPLQNLRSFPDVRSLSWPTKTLCVHSHSLPRHASILLPPATAVATEDSHQQSAPAADSMPPLPPEAKRQRIAICDKLINVFSSRKMDEWRKLIAYSRQWPSLADSVLARILDKAQGAATPDEKLALQRLHRRLNSVHEELQIYNSLLQRFKDAPRYDWESIVALHRSDLIPSFFEHLENTVGGLSAVPREQAELAEMVAAVEASVAAHDQVSQDKDTMLDANASFSELLQAESMEAADATIDKLASDGRLNPALLLTMAKAYSAARETDYTKEEVKDVMAHLYFKAKEKFASEQPAEVRILKHLLTMEDPGQQRASCEEAFKPGAEVQTDKEDFLSTTPERLLTTMDAVLQAFDSQRGKSTMAGEAAGLMHPDVINRMRMLQQLVRQHFT
ncbi:hypothetical protein WJX74_002362 [Apatococcus lobatus]